MALANYTDLLASVATFTNRSDLTSVIPDFVTMAEAELNQRVRIRQNSASTTLTLSADSSLATLPSGFLEEIELNYTVAEHSLSRGSWQDIDRIRASDNSTGRPALYAFSADSVTFERESDAAYSLTLRYYTKWQLATDTTNWLMTNRPDAYLFGAIHEAGLYLGDSEMAGYGKGKRDAAIAATILADSRNKGGVLRTDLGARGSFNITTG